MNWQAVADDTYYQARRLETEARAASSPRKWHAYAELKVRKGSYALGIHGYMNAASLCESSGDAAGAVAAYEKGLEAATRAGYKELAVILTYRAAQLHESAGDWDACIEAYERLAAFCEEQDACFLAADAYEHAAEIMARAGRDVRAYSKPVELWERNARYWEEVGDAGDATWSQKHIALYRKLFEVEE